MVSCLGLQLLAGGTRALPDPPLTLVSATPQSYYMTVPWDTGTAAAAKPPRPSMVVCGARGSVHVVWPRRPVAMLMLWPLSALHPSSSRCVETLARPFLTAALGGRVGCCESRGPKVGRLGCLSTLSVNSPCPGTGGATDWACRRRHPCHHQGLQPGPTCAGRAGHGHGGWSALCGGRSGVRGLQQVSWLHQRAHGWAL